MLNPFELNFPPGNLGHLQLVLEYLLQTPAHQLDPHMPDKMSAVFSWESQAMNLPGLIDEKVHVVIRMLFQIHPGILTCRLRC